jgi:hypothetical protein
MTKVNTTQPNKNEIRPPPYNQPDRQPDSGVAFAVDAIQSPVAEQEQRGSSLTRDYTLREHLHARLGVLKREREKGQVELQEVDNRRAHLRETLLRISGAIQVLEELLAAEPPLEPNGVRPPNVRSDVRAAAPALPEH